MLLNEATTAFKIRHSNRNEGATVRPIVAPSVRSSYYINFRAGSLGRRQWERKKEPVAGTTLLQRIHERAYTGWDWGQATHPLDTVDIGQSRHRFAGGALFRKRQTGLSSFRLLYDCAGVGRPRLDPKRGGPPGPSRGETIATVTFSIESSPPVDIERAMLDSLCSVHAPVSRKSAARFALVRLGAEKLANNFQ